MVRTDARFCVKVPAELPLESGLLNDFFFLLLKKKQN